MKKNKKYILIGLGVVFIIYLIWKNRKGSNAFAKNTTPIATSSVGSSNNTSTSSGCTNTTVLKRGINCGPRMPNNRVQWSQNKINQVASILGIQTLVDDGVFGEKTETAFQKLLGKKTGSWNEVQGKVNALLTGLLTY